MKRVLFAVAIVFCLSSFAFGESQADGFLLVKAALKEDLPDVALLELKKMEPVQGHTAAFWFYRGTAYRKMARYDEAVKSFSKGLTMGKSSAILDGLGMTYERLKEYDKAIECSKKAISGDPTNSLYHGDLGIIYMSQGQPDKAIPEFVTSYRLERSPEAIKRIAMACGMEGDYGKAKRLLIGEFPLSEVYSILAEISRLNGDQEKAKEMRDMARIAVNRSRPSHEEVKGRETGNLP